MGTDRFLSKELSEGQKENLSYIKSNFTALYDYLDNFIPEGREKSLYATKLEEACMWAVKAISREEKEETNNN